MADPSIITSKDNSRLKAARAVRDGVDRSLIFVEGTRLADEMLRSNLSVEDAFLNETLSTSDPGRDFVHRLEQSGTSITACSDSAFRSISDTKNPQGIILLGRRPELRDPADLFVNSQGYLALVYCHEINDPANLGALLRTAEAAGVTGVFLSPRSTDPFSPKALRASMGAAFRLRAASDVDLRSMLSIASEMKVSSIAATGNSERDLFSLDLRGPFVLVLGAEAVGLPDELADMCDVKAHIPMNAPVESLNLAAAGAVFLYEAVRQRTS